MMEQERIDKRIKNAALMHHERFDGKGYPFGLTGDRIDTFASIVAIAGCLRRTDFGSLLPFGSLSF